MNQKTRHATSIVMFLLFVWMGEAFASDNTQAFQGEEIFHAPLGYDWINHISEKVQQISSREKQARDTWSYTLCTYGGAGLKSYLKYDLLGPWGTACDGLLTLGQYNAPKVILGAKYFLPKGLQGSFENFIQTSFLALHAYDCYQNPLKHSMGYMFGIAGIYLIGHTLDESKYGDSFVREAEGFTYYCLKTAGWFHDPKYRQEMMWLMDQTPQIFKDLFFFTKDFDAISWNHQPEALESQTCDRTHQSCVASSKKPTSDAPIQGIQSGLQQILCSDKNPHCLEVDEDNHVQFLGQQEIELIHKKLKNFDLLRQNLIPLSSAHGQTHPAPSDFSCWHEFLRSLGLSPEAFSNMNFRDFKDCETASKELGIAFNEMEHMSFCKDGTPFIALDYGSSESSFNRDLADFFVDKLKHDSPFFRFLLSRDKEIIQTLEKALFIHYGRLSSFFHMDLTRENGRVPVDNVLKILISSAGGPLSLKKDIYGNYRVRVTELGETWDRHDRPVASDVKLLFDTSASMQGDPIDQVNQALPEILQNFQKIASSHGKTVFHVDLYAMNDQLNKLESFQIESSESPFQAPLLVADGRTDLSPIRDFIKTDPEEPRRYIIAITDGDHNMGPPLDEAYFETIKKIRENGSFGKLLSCKAGDLKTNHFFEKLSRIFGTKYSYHHSIQGCLESILKSIKNDLKPQNPLIFTVGKEGKVEWVDLNTITTSKALVHEGDQVVYGDFKASVELP